MGELIKRRCRDREELVRAGGPPDYFVESWDVELEDGRYSVIVSRDELDGEDEPRWHLSVSGLDDVPPWAHLAAIAHSLRPGVPLGVGIPPRSWWLNIAENCLHLWELRDEALLAQWRAEAMGHTPT